MRRTTIDTRWALFGAVAVSLAGCNAMMGLDETELAPAQSGSDAALDTASTGGAGGAGDDASQTGGSGPDSAPDSTQTGGSSGDGGDGAVNDGSSCGDGGVSSGIGSIGQACCQANALACAGNAQKLVLYCDPNTMKWTALQSCGGKQLCSTAAGPEQGSCQDPIAACVGKTPGAIVCDGNKQLTCGPDLVTATEATCAHVCVNGACGGDCSPKEVQCTALSVPQTCDDNGVWIDGPPCAFACKDGKCIGSCKPGDTRCEGKISQLCSALGEWEDKQTCQFVCNAGACSGSCDPGTAQCSTKTPQSCSDKGAWVDGVPCDYLCVGGACSGACLPGTKDCDANKRRTCDQNGAWQVDETCVAICESGACVGSCTPGNKQCNDKTPQTCVAGNWVSGAVCDYVCSSGNCIGVCNPGELQCTGKTPQTCDATGQWKDGTTCQYVCSAGTCGGVCSPGAKQCNGKETQSCSVDGQWEVGTTCPYVCSGGTCSGECVPGATDCNGNTPRTCSSTGFWQSGTACPYLCTNGTCGGVCSPGTKDCDGLVPRTCSPQAQWQTSAACSFVCSAGGCTGVCSPGSKGCSGNTPQTCNALGQWENGSVCPNICSAGVCTGACTPGSKQCNLYTPQVCNNLGQWENGTACSGSAPICSQGACVACSSGTANCDGDSQNGCEVTLSSDPAHCNSCSTSCNSTNGTATCTNGVCGINCNSPWGNCDTNASNGCETNTLSSATNCGACGTVCPSGANSTPVCAAGSCSITCATGYVNCDGQSANGCEKRTVVYVSATGNDSNAGTATAPKKTIQAAVDTVCAPGEVRIAAGTYATTAPIVVNGNISLRGAYNTAFTAQTFTNRSTIVAGAAGAVIELNNPGSTVFVEGLYLKFSASGDGDFTGIDVNTGCPTIRNNIIANAITGTTGTNRGLRLLGTMTGCKPLVASNVIDGGINKTARGIDTNAINNPWFYNNTIHTHGTTYSYPILMQGNGDISNNIIFTSPNVGVCIYEIGTGNVSVLRNNLFVDCVYYYQDKPSGAFRSTIADVNNYALTTQVSGTVGGNIELASLADVHFYSAGDFHLTATTPLSVREGGLLLSIVPQDMDGVARTSPYSIGADEY